MWVSWNTAPISRWARLGFIVPVVLLLGVSGAYTGFWLITAQRIKDSLKTQIVGSLVRRRLIVSRGAFVANARAGGSKFMPPAIDAVVRKRRRVCMIGIGSIPSVALTPSARV
jgi:hypothetical protein